MPSLLVILLTISLVVVGAGLLLSYKPYAQSQRIAPTAHMRQRVIVVDSLPPRDHSVVRSKQLIVTRSAMEVDRYVGASVAIPVTIDHILEQDRRDKPVPWMRMSIGLLAIVLIGLFSLNVLFPRHANWNLIMWYDNSPSTAQSSTQSSQFNPQLNASKSLVRLSQLDPTQYVSSQQFSMWAYSACSTTSLTEVLDAYGRHFRIADVLKVEAGIVKLHHNLVCWMKRESKKLQHSLVSILSGGIIYHSIKLSRLQIRDGR